MYDLYVKGIRDPYHLDQNDYEVYVEARNRAEKGDAIGKIQFSCVDVPYNDIKVVSRKEGSETFRKLNEYSTEELKEIVGDFEREWREVHQMNPGVNTDYGCVFSNGEISLLLRYKAIELDKESGTHAIVVENYPRFARKREALIELQRRRFYAEKIEHLDVLAGDGCPKKECEFCHPITLKKLRDQNPATKTI